MSILNLSDFFNGKMDDWIEKWELLNRTFGNKILSVLLVDPNNEMPIEYVMQRHPNSRIKYIDLAKCCDGDYNRFAQHLNQFKYDGLMIDNVDEIPDNSDREDWEEFVRFALKREADYQLLPFGDCINFNEMHIAVRCKEYPEYIKGKSLQMIIIGV